MGLSAAERMEFSGALHTAVPVRGTVARASTPKIASPERYGQSGRRGLVERGTPFPRVATVARRCNDGLSVERTARTPGEAPLKAQEGQTTADPDRGRPPAASTPLCRRRAAPVRYDTAGRASRRLDVHHKARVRDVRITGIGDRGAG